MALYEDIQLQRPCAVKVVPKAFVLRAMTTGDTEQPLVDSGCARYLTFFVPSVHIPKWYDCGQDQLNVRGGGGDSLLFSWRFSSDVLRQ